MCNLVMTSEQIRAFLEQINIKPIFNVQTPKTEVVDLTNIDDKLLKLLSEVEFFAKHNTYLELAGLAANQVSQNGERINKRICCVFKNGELQTFVNPVILSKFGSTIRSKEGCLTWPDKRIVANRHLGVELKYHNLCDDGSINTVEVIEKIEGYEAIIWQHEIDHLDGVQEEFIIQLKSDEKPGPNSPCICGSGIKYKKCCGC